MLMIHCVDAWDSQSISKVIKINFLDQNVAYTCFYFVFFFQSRSIQNTQLISHNLLTDVYISLPRLFNSILL